MNYSTERIYADQLRHYLALGGLDARQMRGILGSYACAVARTDDAAGTFATFVANECKHVDVSKAVAETKSKIQTELERINSQHTVDVNPVTRLRAYIARHNAALRKMAVEVDALGLSEDQKARLAEAEDRVRLRVPEFAREKTFTALATHQGKTAQLEIEVKF